MNLTVINDITSHLPMIERWISHNQTTKDSTVNGQPINVSSILASTNIEYMSIDNPHTVGITAHVGTGEFLDGVMLWVEPEHRGDVSLKDVFDELLEIASHRGMTGIRFESKIWGNAPEALGFKLAETKQDGADTVCVWQKNVVEA